MSTTRSEGEHALALASNGWVEIVSVPLSGVGDVDNTLRRQVQLPAAAGWGQVRVVLHLPSAGECWTDLGGASLVGVAPGTFAELSWPLSASLRAKLDGSYTDLVVRIQVNAPPGTYLVDDLRFGQEQAETGPWLLPNLPGEIGFNARAWTYGYIHPRSYPLLDSDVVAANRQAAIAICASNGRRTATCTWARRAFRRRRPDLAFALGALLRERGLTACSRGPTRG